MSILMGVMAVLMVVGIVSGHKHMMGVHDKVEQSRELSGEDPDKRRICDNCPAGVDMKDGAVVKEEGQDENKIGEEAGK